MEAHAPQDVQSVGRRAGSGSLGPRESRIAGACIGPLTWFILINFYTLSIEHDGIALTWSPDTVWLFMQKAWWFLVVLGVLVAFHELGHFLAARWVGVKVLKFSLGFGPKLFGRQVGETEYLLSAIPLGGYVKLFGEDEAEAITPEDRRRSFVHQGLWGKVLIVAAGPGFNFILAYFIFAAWLATGYTLPVPSFKDIAPVIEAVVPGLPGRQGRRHDRRPSQKIDGRDIATSIELLDAVAKGNGAPLTLEVLRDGRIKTLTVTPTAAPGPQPRKDERRLLPGHRRNSSGRQRGHARKTRRRKPDFKTATRCVNIEGRPSIPGHR